MLHAVHDIQGLVQYKQPERQAVLQLLLRLLRVRGGWGDCAN